MCGATYLVSITPGEVLGPDVLVRVLDALLKRRHVRPVLPMLVPEVISVEASKNHGRDDGTVSLLPWLAHAASFPALLSRYFSPLIFFLLPFPSSSTCSYASVAPNPGPRAAPGSPSRKHRS